MKFGECVLFFLVVGRSCGDIPFVIVRSVRKERNGRLFRGVSMELDDISFLVHLRIAKWASCRIEFDMKVDGV